MSIIDTIKYELQKLILPLFPLTKSIGTYFTPNNILPQTQNPNQLSSWLTNSHPEYTLSSWCLYGHLIDDDGSVGALSNLEQFMSLIPNLTDIVPELVTSGVKPYQTAVAFSGKKTSGYILSGDVGILGKVAMQVTGNPFSIVTNYNSAVENEIHQSINAITLTSGEVGQKGAIYMLTADAVANINHHEENSKTTASVVGRLQVEIELVDLSGVVSQGFGNSAFFPQFISTDIMNKIEKDYDGSIQKFFKETEERMEFMGSYYYSLPMLKVTKFKISTQDLNGKNTKVVSKGSGGVLWMDYVVQGFDEKSIDYGKKTSWEFFAIQIPEVKASIMVCQITTKQGSGIVSFQYAKLFEKGNHRLPNGAMNGDYIWETDKVQITPDPKSKWKSPQSNKSYYTGFKIELKGDVSFELDVEAVRKDQEIYIKNEPLAPSKYEGVFTVKGTSNYKGMENIQGYAFAELHFTE